MGYLNALPVYIRIMQATSNDFADMNSALDGQNQAKEKTPTTELIFRIFFFDLFFDENSRAAQVFG